MFCSLQSFESGCTPYEWPQGYRHYVWYNVYAHGHHLMIQITNCFPRLSTLSHYLKRWLMRKRTVSSLLSSLKTTRGFPFFLLLRWRESSCTIELPSNAINGDFVSDDSEVMSLLSFFASSSSNIHSDVRLMGLAGSCAGVLYQCTSSRWASMNSIERDKWLKLFFKIVSRVLLWIIFNNAISMKWKSTLYFRVYGLDVWVYGLD